MKSFTNPNNVDIFNAIRKGASLEFQRRIPFVTKANINQYAEKMISNTPIKNEFIGALMNRLAGEIFRQITWQNPYAKFKGPQVEFGSTIEEIMVGLINSKVYDPNRPAMEKTLFGVHDVEVQTSFHAVNREEFYVVTINDFLLRRAFTSDHGLSSLVTQLMEAPAKSDQWDEYLTMASLFRLYFDNGGFFRVNIDDLTSADADSPQAKAALKKLRAFAGKIQFLSRNYNAAGMPIAASPDELELFITPEALATLDVDALASAFNMGKADVPFKINLIPAEDLNIPGAQMILTTRDFFVVRDTLVETREQVNAGALHTNYFLHHHQIVSVSRFVPAILFWTGEGDVIPTEETPVTGIADLVAYDLNGDVHSGGFERGESYQIASEATTTPTGGPNNSVEFEITSAYTSPYTRLRTNGILSIGQDETATTITVKGTTTEGDFSKSLTRSVVGDRVSLWPNPGETAPDADKDGLYEVTPAQLELADDDTVTIPEVEGVQYKKGGTDVDAGTIHPITTATTFTAVAKAGFELKPGATASWTFGDE